MRESIIKKIVAFCANMARTFFAAFTLMTITISLEGRLFSTIYPDLPDTMPLFALGTVGMTHNIIMQIALYCFLLAFFSEIIGLEVFMNIKYIARLVILYAVDIVMICVFALMFDWFPLTEWQPWFWTIASLVFCMTIYLVWLYITAKREDRRFNKMLHDYKKRHGELGDKGVSGT